MTLFARTNTISQTKTRWVNQVFDASDTFTVPSGVRKINTVVVGGGGRTYNINAWISAGGAGGGGVGFSKNISVTPGEEITVQVGGGDTATILYASSRTVEAGPGADGNGLNLYYVNSSPTQPDKNPPESTTGTSTFYRGCSAGGHAVTGYSASERNIFKSSGNKEYGRPADAVLTNNDSTIRGGGGGGGASLNPSYVTNNYAQAYLQSGYTYNSLAVSESTAYGHAGNGVDGKTIVMDSGYEITAGGGGGAGGYTVTGATQANAVSRPPSDVKAGQQGSGSCGVGQSAQHFYVYTYTYQSGTDANNKPIYSTSYYLQFSRNGSSTVNGKCVIEWRQRR